MRYLSGDLARLQAESNCCVVGVEWIRVVARLAEDCRNRAAQAGARALSDDFGNAPEARQVFLAPFHEYFNYGIDCGLHARQPSWLSPLHCRPRTLGRTCSLALRLRRVNEFPAGIFGSFRGRFVA